MIERRTALVLALVVGGLALGVAAPSTGAPTTQENYSLDELKGYGPQPAGQAPDSMRWMSEYGTVTVRHEPAGLGGAQWEYLEPGQVVHDDELTLVGMRAAPASELDQELNVTVVSWQHGREKRKVGNTTKTIAKAENVTVWRQRIELGRGYDNATVDLPAHYDERWQVSVWIEEYPDARWRFVHRSVETSRSVPFDADWGGFWGFNLPNLLLPILGLTSAVSVGVPMSLRRTARGPKLGFFKWGVALCVLTGAALSIGYVFTTSLLASAPWAVSAVVATLVGIIMLETIEYGTYDVVLARFFHDDGENPRGELAAESNGAEYERVTFANVSDGVIVLSDGLEAWLARLWVGGAYLQGLDNLRNEFSLGNANLSFSSSPADKLLFVAQEPEFLVAYEPEHLALDLPFTKVVDEETGETAIDFNGIGHIVLTLMIGAGVGYGALKAGNIPFERLGLLLGPVAVAARFTVPRAGEAYVHPALGHTEDAVATAMYYENEIQEYKSLEEALQRFVEERNSEDEIAAKLNELDDENIVSQAYARDTGAGEFVDDASSSSGSESAAAGGDD